MLYLFGWVSDVEAGQVWVLDRYLVRRVFREIIVYGDWKSLSRSVIGHRKFGIFRVFI